MGLEGELSPASLAAAFAEVLRRHEVLRTHFEDRDGRPVQVVALPGAVGLPRIDLARLPHSVARRETRRLAAEEGRAPFDLGRGPLARFRLVRIGTDEHVAFVTVHHAVSDGWSTGILVREVAVLYQAAVAGQPSPLADLAIQYGDYAAWQRRWLDGEVLAAELEHWRQRLAGAPPLLELPIDRPRPAVQRFRGRSVPFALDGEITGALLGLAPREWCDAFHGLVGGLQGCPLAARRGL